MSITTMDKATKCVKRVIANKLNGAIKRSTDKVAAGGSINEKLRIADVSEEIMEGLLADDEAIESLALLLGLRIPKKDVWISTEKAAEKMGFSRPYVVALLDSDDFKGSVVRKDGGHRRVLESAVDTWMESHRVKPIRSAAELAKLNQPDDPEFFNDDMVRTDSEVIAKKTAILEGRKRSLLNRP